MGTLVVILAIVGYLAYLHNQLEQSTRRLKEMTADIKEKQKSWEQDALQAGIVREAPHGAQIDIDHLPNQFDHQTQYDIPTDRYESTDSSSEFWRQVDESYPFPENPTEPWHSRGDNW